jgi:hypothetical protein
MSLIFLTPVACAFVTVGTDVACTYDNLEDAYNDDDIFVRVTTQVTFNDNFVITKPKWFTGGYASCLDIYNGNPPVENARTKWQSTDNNTVIKINAQLAANSTIVIDGFEIFNGVNNNPYLAGGIQVEGNSQLLLSNSSVYDNLGASGGGIMVAGENAGVLINNSLIHDNESQLGGGIFCEDHASVSILGESAINNNEAEVGGGIWGNEECEIQMNSGDTLAPLDAQYGILRNTARVGGGAYLIGGSNMEIKGSTEHPASILLNIADTEDIESGGGVFLSDPDTRFEAINGRIESNIGVFYGAGFAVQNQAVFVMRRLPGDCWDNSRCSSLSNNILTSSQDSEVGYGGAGDLYEGGVANISQTRIDGNLANTASGFNLDEYAYLRSEGNLIINNRDFNNDTDTTLINVLGSPGNGSNVDMFYNTLANNTTTAPMIRAVNDSQQIINVFNSIIDHTSSDILGFFNNAPHNSLLQWECLFVSEVTSLAGNIGFVSTEDPMFVNKVQSNYRLSPASPAIDACDESAFIGASYPDFDGRDRGIDEPGIQNLFGPFDVGAYEANVDIIFANGFE